MRGKQVTIGGLVLLILLLLAGTFLINNKGRNQFSLARRTPTPTPEPKINPRDPCLKFTDLAFAKKHKEVVCWLDLSGQNLSALPASILSLSKPTRITLNNNSFNEFPQLLLEFGSLKEIDLENNQISSIPDSISKLALLEKLDLRSNKVSNLPASISKLKNLKELVLSGNNISAQVRSQIKSELPQTKVSF